jgi:hypothetical protein
MFRNAGLQVAEYEYDFAVDGGATGVFTLSSKANKALIPEDAIVCRVTTRVVTAFTGTDASASVGNSAGAATYLALRDVDGAAADGLGADQLAAYTTQFVADALNERDVLVTVSGGAITAGKLKVLVEFLHHNP